MCWPDFWCLCTQKPLEIFFHFKMQKKKKKNRYWWTNEPGHHGWIIFTSLFSFHLKKKKTIWKLQKKIFQPASWCASTLKLYKIHKNYLQVIFLNCNIAIYLLCIYLRQDVLINTWFCCTKKHLAVRLLQYFDVFLCTRNNLAFRLTALDASPTFGFCAQFYTRLTENSIK